MDAASFPILSYAGNCQAQGDLEGMLAMHGVTRPFALSLDWSRDGVAAEGRLARADWGMTAMPLLGGRTVRIRVTVPLAGGRQAGQPSRDRRLDPLRRATDHSHANEQSRAEHRSPTSPSKITSASCCGGRTSGTWRCSPRAWRMPS